MYIYTYIYQTCTYIYIYVYFKQMPVCKYVQTDTFTYLVNTKPHRCSTFQRVYPDRKNCFGPPLPWQGAKPRHTQHRQNAKMKCYVFKILAKIRICTHACTLHPCMHFASHIPARKLRNECKKQLLDENFENLTHPRPDLKQNSVPELEKAYLS
jgi:hypothetical protein